MYCPPVGELVIMLTGASAPMARAGALLRRAGALWLFPERYGSRRSAYHREISFLLYQPHLLNATDLDFFSEISLADPAVISVR